MRFSMLQLLKELKLHGREVSDADIIHWANLKVRNVGKTSRMESFKVNCISIDQISSKSNTLLSSLAQANLVYCTAHYYYGCDCG